MARRAGVSTNAAARLARPAFCHHCGRPILRGLDGDRAALTVDCDPTEIDTRGELIAMALKLPTYMLTRAVTTSGESGWNLDPRYPTAVASGQRTALLAAHRCGIAIPPAAHKRESLFEAAKPLPEDVPF